MHKTIYKTAIFSLLTLLCISCSNDFDSQSDNDLSRIVLNSVFTPGELMTVHLATTRQILDSNSTFRNIKTADVEVTNNLTSEVYRLAHIGDGNYQSEEFRPTFGGSYTVTAHAEGFETVQASSKVPVQAFVSQTDVYQGDFTEDGNKRELFVNLEFYSESTETQYYVWEVINDERRPNNDFDFNDVSDGPVLLNSQDSRTESVLADESFQTRVFLTDNGSQGPIQTEFVVETDPVIAFQFGDNTDEDADVLLKVRAMTVSKDLYEYFKSIEIYRLRGEVNSSITQPIDIHSNVDGGLGIFAGLTSEIIKIKLN
jgi:hypothetical protein